MEAPRTPIEVSLARRPLVVVTFRSTPTDAEFSAYLDQLYDNVRYTLARRTKTAVLLDTTHSPLPASARQRKLQADWLKDHYAELRLACVGLAFVIQSSLVRGAMTAVLWLQDMPYPYTVVSSFEQADVWCTEQLMRAGYEVPKSA